MTTGQLWVVIVVPLALAALWMVFVMLLRVRMLRLRQRYLEQRGQALERGLGSYVTDDGAGKSDARDAFEEAVAKMRRDIERKMGLGE